MLSAQNIDESFLLVGCNLRWKCQTQFIRKRRKEGKRRNVRTTQLNQEKKTVEKQNELITKSISYAKRIQYSILPNNELMSELQNMEDSGISSPELRSELKEIEELLANQVESDTNSDFLETLQEKVKDNE